MSWWDTSNFSSLASQALKNAQKTIDKALDISEGGGTNTASAGKRGSQKPAASKTSGKKSEGNEGGEFWNSWFTGAEGEKPAAATSAADEKKPQTPSQGTSPLAGASSWSFSWGQGNENTETKTEIKESSSWSSFQLGDLELKSSGKDDSVQGKLSESLLLGKKSSKSKLSDSETVTDVGEPKQTLTESGKTDQGAAEKEMVKELTSLPLPLGDDTQNIEKRIEDYHEPVGKESLDVDSVPSKVETGESVSEEVILPDALGDNTDDSRRGDKQFVQDASVLHESVTPPGPGTPQQEQQIGVAEDVYTISREESESFLDAESVISSRTDAVPSEGEGHATAEGQESLDSNLPKDVKKDTSAEISIISLEDSTASEKMMTSDSGGVDTSQGVTLQIPDSWSEQFQIDQSTPVSSEASIITLSSPGQDDFDSMSPSQSVSNQQITSEYINISTTQLGSLPTTQLGSQSVESRDSGEPQSEEQETKETELQDRDSSTTEREYLEREKELGDLGQSSGNDSSDASKLDSSMDTCTSGDTVVEQQSAAVGKDSDSDSAHDQEKSDDSFPAASPNSSYVKCMIEEAMEDTSKPEDSGSDNHSCGEKSESSKVESEIDKSVSGQESSDDIETTTSSDIEIISAPTPNGEKNERMFDLSPLRIALQKTVRKDSHSHRRTDSQSSGSTYSKTGDSDQMSPGRDSLERQDLESGEEDLRAPDLSAVSEEDLDNPYHPQKLLQADQSPQQHQMIKKLAEKSEILQHRENKLVQLSKDNNDLLEANSILRNQLLQLEELRETEMTDLNALTEEFTKRLSEAEKKLQGSIKEKETLKRQLQLAQEELGKHASDVSHERLLAEKDEQITELLAEGEKLSKQQLQSNNIIKKLRTKEKENESTLTSQKKKLEEQKSELEHLHKVCDAKEDLEKKQTDAINQLNNAIQKQEKEILKYKSEHEESGEKVRSLQVALDNSYKEIADLHKMNAAQDSKAQEAALSAEVAVREALKMEMEREGQRYRQERETLIIQIEDLRLSMARMEKEHNRREDMLRQEISDLQMQLQEDEARNQELTHSVSSATRPLLRQIENLQSNYAAQSTSWEKVEKNLTERLAEAQNQLAMAVEKERCASEKLMDQNIRLTTLESQTARLRQEKSQLLAQAEMDKAKIEILEEAKLNEMAQVDAVKNKMSKEMNELKKDKVFLETQLETEKARLDTEKKRQTVLEEQIRFMERERPKSRGTPSPVSVSRQESVSSFSAHPEFLPILPQEDLLERTLMLASPNGSKMNLYESLRQSGAATLLENLQSQLKQKEGEILQLQSEIASLERTRESMAKELVNLTNVNEELQEHVQELPLVQEKYQDLDQRYNALLQMYGEKVEQTEELKLDLQDVKDMYKAQIDQLLQQ